jgi:hypothetical protein
MIKYALLFVCAALTGASLIAGASTPAEAGEKKFCQYIAGDTSDNQVQGHAWRRKEKSACTVARQRCNRRLERKQPRHKSGRTDGCKKLTEVSG